MAQRANQKLSFKFFGPYKVVDKIGSVAYKLLLPLGSSIHPVFHVSLLKPAPPSASPPSSSQVPPPPDLSDGLQVPEKILQRRLYHRGSSTVPQLLIKWSGVDFELATWEDADYIVQQFPGAPAWGHAVSQGGSVSVPLTLATLMKAQGPGAAQGRGPKAPSYPAQSGSAPCVCV